jgi:hypothetical protein
MKSACNISNLPFYNLEIKRTVFEVLLITEKNASHKKCSNIKIKRSTKPVSAAHQEYFFQEVHLKITQN